MNTVVKLRNNVSKCRPENLIETRYLDHDSDVHDLRNILRNTAVSKLIGNKFSKLHTYLIFADLQFSMIP